MQIHKPPDESVKFRRNPDSGALFWNSHPHPQDEKKIEYHISDII